MTLSRDKITCCPKYWGNLIINIFLNTQYDRKIPGFILNIQWQHTVSQKGIKVIFTRMTFTEGQGQRSG